jgi:CHAT domain-containing protein
VRSACNTAAGNGAGAEAVSGLGRAFFYAGARALLVSNWPVETNAARTLTTDLFRRQAENPRLGRAEALREAELALLDGTGAVDPTSQQPLFSYAHPIFWAPFTLVGDGGGARTE